jgi:8-oxo-dGTP pyrophosphatase MutT (NUDIX family)
VANSFHIETLRGRLLSEVSLLTSQNALPEAAVAIIIDPKDRGSSALFIQRKERLGDPWSGQIAFPGGHKSAVDKSILETAVREVREEVGIDLSNHELLGVLPLMRAHTRSISVAPFVFQLKSSAIVKLNDEVTESFWVPLSFLGELNISKSEVKGEKGKLAVDSYIYEGRIIWGLTFRIVNILLARNMQSNA